MLRWYRNYISIFSPLFLVHAERSPPLNNISGIDSTILNKSKSVLTRRPLCSDESLKDEVNLIILNATIVFKFYIWILFFLQTVWWTTSSSPNSQVFFLLFMIIWLHFFWQTVIFLSKNMYIQFHQNLLYALIFGSIIHKDNALIFGSIIHKGIFFLESSL